MHYLIVAFRMILGMYLLKLTAAKELVAKALEFLEKSTNGSSFTLPVTGNDENCSAVSIILHVSVCQMQW